MSASEGQRDTPEAPDSVQPWCVPVQEILTFLHLRTKAACRFR